MASYLKGYKVPPRKASPNSETNPDNTTQGDDNVFYVDRYFQDPNTGEIINKRTGDVASEQDARRYRDYLRSQR